MQCIRDGVKSKGAKGINPFAPLLELYDAASVMSPAA